MLEAWRIRLMQSLPRTFFLYALCGGSGVLIDMAIYSALIAGGVDYQIANAVGYASGTLLSFVLNRHFTFQVYDNTARRMAQFFATAAVGYLMSSVLLWVLVDSMGISPIVAKALTLGAVLILQFSLNRAITFRQR